MVLKKIKGPRTLDYKKTREPKAATIKNFGAKAKMDFKKESSGISHLDPKSEEAKYLASLRRRHKIEHTSGYARPPGKIKFSGENMRFGKIVVKPPAKTRAGFVIRAKAVPINVHAPHIKTTRPIPTRKGKFRITARKR